MATPATYTSRMADAPSPERGGSRRRPRRCLPGPAGRRRSSSRPACRSGAARDRARRRSGSSAPTRPQAGRRRRPRTAPGPRAWTGARSTRPRASPCATAGSPRTAPRRYTGSTRAARPGRPPRTAGSAGRPGRARPRRADGGRERSGGGRAALEGVAAALGKGGAEVLVVPTDVTALESVRALADAAERRFGAVHIVCNNAGVATMSEIAASTHADWQYTMNVNFWGVVHGVETFVPRLLARGAGGHIVNTASMAGLVGMRWLGVYCASKFAVVGLSEALHRELAEHGIGVSVLCPMIVETKINEDSIRNRPAALRNPGEAAVPEGAAMMGSVIGPEEVARRVVRGIERKDLYIFTHPEQRAILQRRAARQDRMFEPDRW